MRLVALAATAAGFALLLAGCGSGPKVTETRSVPSFHRLVVEGGIDVTVRPGPRTAVDVTSGKNVIDDVHTDVDAGTLTVNAHRRGIVVGPDGLDGTRLRVTVPRLSTVAVHGSGDVRLSQLSGAGLELSIEGSGDVRATGRVRRVTVEVHGSGDIDLDGLATRRATVALEGSGDATLNVSDALDVIVRGSGDVAYRGDPRVTSSVRGSGELRRLP